MSSLREKLERVHSLLINEENEQAELLFHEAFVEAAREIHKNIIEEEDWLDDSDGEEVDETIDVNAASDEIEGEEQNESFYAEVTPLGEVEDEEMVDDEMPMGDEEGMDDEEMAGDELEGDMEDGEAEEGDLESRIADLEADLEALKAEFEELGDEGEAEEGDESDDEGEESDEMDEGMFEGNELSTQGSGPSNDGHAGAGKEPGDRRKHPTSGGKGPTPGDKNVAKGHGDKDGVYEEVDALDESFELEAVSNTNTEAGIGSGKSFDPSLNKTSPIPQKKGSARQGGSAVNPNAKGNNHKGFDRENAPATQQMEKRKNVRSNAEEDMSKMSKEGDKSAALNKTESEFGKGNVTSPIGSKGSVQTKGLTESRKRKS